MVFRRVDEHFSSGSIELPSSSLTQKFRGHFQTIAPFLRRAQRSRVPIPTEYVSVDLVDPVAGPVRLSAELYRAEGASQPGDALREPAVIALHGLGGSSGSGYMREALGAAHQLKVNLLLFNARGSDRSGQDINHAGLTEDLAAWTSSPLFADCPKVGLMGYSLGGHLALSYSCRSPDKRVHKVAALCSPLSLAESAAAFDEPSFSVYRQHVLSSLYEIYTAAFQRRPSGCSPEAARRIKNIVDWDEQIVAPRFGYENAQAYYASQSVAPVLHSLKVPALYLGAVHDPMVPHVSVVPGLQNAQKVISSGRLRCLWDHRAGHLGFARDWQFPSGFLEYGAAPQGVEAQVLSWLLE